MPQQTVFPELERFLQRELEDWGKRKGTSPPRARRLQTLIKNSSRSKVTISHSSLHDWFHGRAKPQTESLRILAGFFYPDDVTKQAQFEEEGRRATVIAHATEDPLDALNFKERPLRIGTVDFPYFCQHDGTGFLDGVMTRLVGFTGLAAAEFERVEIADVERKLCDTGELDIVLGLFAEHSRSRRIWFSRQIPLLIPLNAVAIGDVGKKDDILQLLTDPRTSQTARDKIAPVVDPAELGGIYAKNHLRFSREHDTFKVSYAIDAYVEKFKQLSREREDKRLPVAIIDEVSCAMVLVELQKARLKPQLIGAPRARKNLSVGAHFFPQYRYSFAVARQHTRWTQFISDALAYFVESNQEIVANQLFELAKSLWDKFDGSVNEAQTRVRSWLTAARGDYIWEEVVDLAQQEFDGYVRGPKVQKGRRQSAAKT